ncbi:MAG TPA: NAD(P)-dependent oxidoreductase, partial [Nakamurella sp.]|jgi:dTDP-4-dehydrorhamnose 3,5-epimerase
LVLGAGGQLGRALHAEFTDRAEVEYATRADLDLTAGGFADARTWSNYDVIINAAAFTGVDAAETDEGRRDAWAANVTAVATMARVATQHRLALIHVSSDYVFDGTLDRPYRESDPVCPVGAYGQTKAAGDAIVGTVPRHYVLRSSWVVGDGKNFVRTMASLAERGIEPKVVDDQIGRLTFASEMARAIRHLLESGAPYGTYHLTGGGVPASWCEVARLVFELTGNDPIRVSGVSTEAYFANASGPVASRPANSVLDVSKIEASGFAPVDWRITLAGYLGG